MVDDTALAYHLQCLYANDLIGSSKPAGDTHSASSGRMLQPYIQGVAETSNDTAESGTSYALTSNAVGTPTESSDIRYVV